MGRLVQYYQILNGELCPKEEYGPRYNSLPKGKKWGTAYSVPHHLNRFLSLKVKLLQMVLSES